MENILLIVLGDLCRERCQSAEDVVGDGKRQLVGRCEGCR